MEELKATSPLIIDADEEFVGLIEVDPQIKLAKPFIAKTGKKAQLIIANEINPIAAIFINLDLPATGNEPDAAQVIKFARSRRLEVPIYALGVKGAQMTDELLKMGVRGMVNKPINYSELLKVSSPHVSQFELGKVSEKSRLDPLDKEFSAPEPEFVPIVAKDFVSGTVTNFAIYARTNSGRYIKILHPGDEFDPIRLQNYLKKGVKYFHIRKEDQEQYLMFSERISSKIVSAKKKFSIKAQVSQTMNYGQETVSYLTSQGLNDSRVFHAINFSKNMQAVASKLAEENEAVADLILDVDCYEHGVSICMLTSLIAHASGIESKSAVQMVGMASLFHDIALPGSPKDLEYHDVDKMTEDEKRLYYSHPRLGAEMMQKIQGTHITVVQAIAQHHERKGQKAFAPDQERPKAVSGIAEMIGLADEYLRLIQRARAHPGMNMKSVLESEVFQLFSLDQVEAFNKVFFPKKK